MSCRFFLAGFDFSFLLRILIKLGMMFFAGTGVPQNYAEAAKWYRKAAEQVRAFPCLKQSANGVELAKEIACRISGLISIAGGRG
jgi:hypothetical protein